MQLHPKRSSCMKFIKNHSIMKISTVKMAKVHHNEIVFFLQKFLKKYVISTIDRARDMM